MPTRHEKEGERRKQTLRLLPKPNQTTELPSKEAKNRRKRETIKTVIMPREASRREEV